MLEEVSLIGGESEAMATATYDGGMGQAWNGKEQILAEVALMYWGRL